MPHIGEFILPVANIVWSVREVAGIQAISEFDEPLPFVQARRQAALRGRQRIRISSQIKPLEVECSALLVRMVAREACEHLEVRRRTVPFTVASTKRCVRATDCRIDAARDLIEESRGLERGLLRRRRAAAQVLYGLRNGRDIAPIAGKHFFI